MCFAARSGGQKNWPLVLLGAPWRCRAQTSRRVIKTGPARVGPVAGPALVSPAYQDNKLEDVEGLPGGRLRTAHPVPTVQSWINSRKYRSDVLAQGDDPLEPPLAYGPVPSSPGRGPVSPGSGNQARMSVSYAPNLRCRAA